MILAFLCKNKNKNHKESKKIEKEKKKEKQKKTKKKHKIFKINIRLYSKKSVYEITQIKCASVGLSVCLPASIYIYMSVYIYIV